MDEFMNIRSEILSKQKIDKKDLLWLKSIENEFGALPTGETIIELQNTVLITRVAEKLKKHDQA